MAQGFASKPQTDDPLESLPVRTNFEALVSFHIGSVEPSPAFDGMFWIDDTDANNVKLKRRLSGTFVILIEHLEGLGVSGFVPVFKGNAETFVFDQVPALTTWNIVHNLAKFPSITLVDTTGFRIPDALVTSIEYLDENEISVNFPISRSGKAFIN